MDDNLDIDTLPILDIEYYFLNLRARSVSEVVEAKYKCNNPVDDKECGNIMDANINVLDIKVTKDENIKEIIQINDTIAVKLKYPTFSSIANAAEVKDVNEIALQMVVDSIDTIYDGQQSFPAKESSKEELMEFVESLNQHQFQKIQEFFENLPKLDKLINLKCKKCGFDHVIVFEGLESFFD